MLKISISVYPNPVTDVLRIESGSASQSVEVFRVDGSKIADLPIPVDKAAATVSGSNFREVDLRRQNPGIYVVIIDGRSFKVLKN